MKIKKLKIKLNKDNEYSDYRYFMPKSSNITLADGENIDEAVQTLRDKVASLKEQASYLISKAPLVKYAEGSSIIAIGSADAELRKLAIEGNSYQERREGYNFLPLEPINTTINGVVIMNNGDGSITLNGTTSAYTSITIFANREILLPADTYTIRKKEFSGTYTTPSQFLELKDANDERILMFGGMIGTMTLAQDSVVAKGHIAFAANTVFNNYTFALWMVNAENFNKPYEQYGINPNPNYISDIVRIGDNINLFNKNTAVEGKYVDNSGGVQMQNDVLHSDYIKVQPLTSYVISGRTSWSSVGLYDKDKNFLERTASSGINGVLHIFNPDCQYVRINAPLINKNTLKFEKGIQHPTFYSDYNKGGFQINNHCQNFLYQTGTQMTINGVTFTPRVDGSIIMNGTATADANFPICGSNWSATQKRILLNKGEYYTIGKGTNNAIIYCRDSINNINVSTNLNEVKATNQLSILTFVYIQVQQGRTVNNEIIYPMIVKGQYTNNTFPQYQQYQGSNQILLVQQPFGGIGVTKDCFVNDNGVWYEEHNLARYTFTGEEHFVLSTFNEETGIYQYRTNQNFLTNLKTTPDPFHLEDSGLSNYFIKLTSANDLQEEGFTLSGEKKLCFNTKFKTVEDFTTWIQNKYNAGLPLYIDYILANPIQLECTLEQISILQQLKTYLQTTYIDTDIINNTQPNIKLIYKQDINAILEEEGI